MRSQPSPVKRRDSHKLVERRRREAISTGIDELTNLVPGCTERNKAAVIRRTIEYITHLKATEKRNTQTWSLEKVCADHAITELATVMQRLNNENEAMRTQVEQMGGRVPPRIPLPPAAAAAAAGLSQYHPLAAVHPDYQYFASCVADCNK